MKQSPGCCRAYADEESAYRLDDGGRSSARCGDKITERVSRPSSSVRMIPKAASPRKRWVVLGCVVAMSITLIGVSGAHGANNRKPAGSSDSSASASPSPDSTSSPAITSSPQTPADNAADDGWPLPPLVAGDWVTPDKQASQDLIDRLVKLASTPETKWIETWARRIIQFRTKQLSFYPGAKLCEGLVPPVDHGAASIFSFILLKDGIISFLSGTAQNIHLLNRHIPVELRTREQVESYLRFFTAAIFGDYSNFRIVDGLEDPLWARDTSEADKQRAAKYIRPLLMDQLDDGRWKANVTMQYSTALFSAVLYILPTGMIEMADDVPIAANLPLRREAFNGPLRYEVGLYK